MRCKHIVISVFSNFPNINKKNDEESSSINIDKVGVPLSNRNIILFNYRFYSSNLTLHI